MERSVRGPTRARTVARAAARARIGKAVVCGIRHNPVIRARYDRLRKQTGTPKQVVIVTCMRTLLTSANAVVRDAAPWRPRAAAMAEANARPPRTRRDTQYGCSPVEPGEGLG